MLIFFIFFVVCVLVFYEMSTPLGSGLQDRGRSSWGGRLGGDSTRGTLLLDCNARRWKGVDLTKRDVLWVMVWNFPRGSNFFNGHVIAVLFASLYNVLLFDRVPFEFMGRF